MLQSSSSRIADRSRPCGLTGGTSGVRGFFARWEVLHTREDTFAECYNQLFGAIIKRFDISSQVLSHLVARALVLWILDPANRPTVDANAASTALLFQHLLMPADRSNQFQHVRASSDPCGSMVRRSLWLGQTDAVGKSQSRFQ